MTGCDSKGGPHTYLSESVRNDGSDDILIVLLKLKANKWKMQSECEISSPELRNWISSAVGSSTGLGLKTTTLSLISHFVNAVSKLHYDGILPRKLMIHSAASSKHKHKLIFWLLLDALTKQHYFLPTSQCTFDKNHCSATYQWLEYFVKSLRH